MSETPAEDTPAEEPEQHHVSVEEAIIVAAGGEVEEIVEVIEVSGGSVLPGPFQGDPVEPDDTSSSDTSATTDAPSTSTSTSSSSAPATTTTSTSPSTTVTSTGSSGTSTTSSSSDPGTTPSTTP